MNFSIIDGEQIRCEVQIHARHSSQLSVWRCINTKTQIKPPGVEKKVQVHVAVQETFGRAAVAHSLCILCVFRSDFQNGLYQ